MRGCSKITLLLQGKKKGIWPKYEKMPWLGGGVGVGVAPGCIWEMTNGHWPYVYPLCTTPTYQRDEQFMVLQKQQHWFHWCLSINIFSKLMIEIVIPEYYYSAKWKDRNPPSEIEFSQIVLLCWILWQVCAPLIHLGGCFRLPILSLDGIAAQKLRSPPFTAIEGSISQELTFQQLTSSFKWERLVNKEANQEVLVSACLCLC